MGNTVEMAGGRHIFMRKYAHIWFQTVIMLFCTFSIYTCFLDVFNGGTSAPLANHQKKLPGGQLEPFYYKKTFLGTPTSIIEIKLSQILSEGRPPLRAIMA